MSVPENFLSRWSRRKREMLRETAAVIAPPEAIEGKPAEKNRASAEGSALSESASAVSTFDPASLPPIQSITAHTDIRGFLASGVPCELTRAALRRAWACDPAIRNFVGLADYDWDFNAAGSMAGFGPLPMTDEVREMAAQIVEANSSEPAQRNFLDSAPTNPKAVGTDSTRPPAAEMHDQAKHSDEPANNIGTPLYPNELTHSERGPAAPQYKDMTRDSRNVLVRRQHGSALPE